MAQVEMAEGSRPAQGGESVMAFHKTVIVGADRVDIAIEHGSIWMTFRDSFGDKTKVPEVSISNECAIAIATMLLNAAQTLTDQS
jgi:hypothetical protein